MTVTFPTSEAVSAATVGNSPLDNYASPVFTSLSQWPNGVHYLGEWWRAGSCVAAPEAPGTDPAAAGAGGSAQDVGDR